MTNLNNIDGLNYEGLKRKAYREIERLIKAQTDLESEFALDHALNAAFTIYHLLEWQEESNSSNKVRAHQSAAQSKCSSIKMLHDIVTYTKHATVSKPLSKEKTKINNFKKISNLITEDGDNIIVENGGNIVTEDSVVIVNFGSKRADIILKSALSEFFNTPAILTGT